MTRFERGGLNSGYRVLLFDNGNEDEDLKVILVRSGLLDEVYQHEIHETLFMDRMSFVTVFSGVISREDAQTMFLENIFKRTQSKEEIFRKVIFYNKFFISYEDAVEIIEKRSKRCFYHLCETHEPHKFVVPKLKKVKCFKRERNIVVTRQKFRYSLLKSNGDTKIVDFRNKRKHV